jgi:hypothetical protein
MKVVYCPNSIVTHRKVELPPVPEYEKIRWNRQDLNKFFKKWDLNFVQDAQGRRLVPISQDIAPIPAVPAPTRVLSPAEAGDTKMGFGIKRERAET